MLKLSTRVLFVLLTFACMAGAQDRPLYLDPSQPLQKRVDDIVGRMTLEEKIGQMMYRAPAIERLGIPAYNWWGEALHGVARAGVATVFPQAIGLAATWDAPLLQDVAGVISTEARAKYNDALRRGVHAQYYGLTFWSPNINIFRDPRWGRGQETYGEDPFLTATMGVAFVRGMQGNDPRYLKVVSTSKHFGVHSGPEPLRHEFDADVSPHDMEDTYFPAFEATVSAGHADSVMCAYNAVEGAPACANTMLLKTHLRGAWGFDGYVVSDCGAVGDIQHGHKFAATPEQAAADAVKAGTDLDCGDEYKSLLAAVRQGLVTEADIDQAVKRLFTARFRLGMFDPPETVPYSSIPFSENDSSAHRGLSLRVARESMVLLKNDGALPFTSKIKKIAVIGPNADSIDVLYGNYNGGASHPVTVLDGIRTRFGATNVVYAEGSPLAAGMELVTPSDVLRPRAGSSEHGLRAEYFHNTDLSGAPALTRVDSNIDFDFEANPAPNFGTEHFSVRWTGVLVPRSTGDYQIGGEADDGFRLFLEGRKLVDAWDSRNSTGHFASIHLEAGHEYPITFEYFQTNWGATAKLLWLPPNLSDGALGAARQSDAVVMVLGISPRLEGEEMKVDVPGFSGGDRTSLDLPDAQEKLLESVAATGKPLVLVLLNGSALSVNWAQEHANAILEAWYPGEEGGTAVADTLAGDNNPAGRLPVTFYKSVDDLPPFTDYAMKGRTYRYFQERPLYRFGDGLSYSSFVYANPAIRTAADGVTASVDVENASDRDGDEVVQAYLSARDPSQERLLPPNPALVGFQRVHLPAHAKINVSVPIPASVLTGVDDQGVRKPLAGPLHLDIGGHQPGTGTVGVDFTR